MIMMISSQETRSASQNYNDIVISGMSGKFPDSNDVQEYLNQLSNKINLCNEKLHETEVEHPEVPNLIGRIKNEKACDIGMFGMHPCESNYVDIGIRILLEETIKALFDAGVHPDEIKGSKTGVFIANTESGFQQMCYGNPPKGASIITGTEKSMAAQRISYYLQVDGPSITNDTACSSTMFALDAAYRSILSGKCDRAIIGGFNTCLDTFMTLQFARLGVLNPGSGCRPFDNNANGYTRSEAMPIIFMQRRAEAKRVYGHLVHVKTNCDGYKQQGITFPSMNQQYQLLKEAYEEAQVSPDEIGFLEAHGTGTVVGDPEELGAIDKLFQRTSTDPLLIGSVKGNIGHSEPCAAICSIVKVLGILNCGKIIPNIHYDTPKEHISALFEKRVKVVTDVMHWPHNKQYAGTNSFGFGGANGHAILKKFNKPKSLSCLDKFAQMIVCYSGRSRAALDRVHEAIIDCNDLEYISLIQEFFKQPINNHIFRGFTIAGSNVKVGSRLTQVNPGKVLFVITKFKENMFIADQQKLPFFKNMLRGITEQIQGLGNYDSSTLLQLFIIATIKKVSSNMDIFPFDELSKQIRKYFCNFGNLNDMLTQLISNKKELNLDHKLITEFILSNLTYGRKPTIMVIGHEKLPSRAHVLKRCNVIQFDDNLTQDKFLFNLGLLHQYGYDVALNKLFNPGEYPVSCGTNTLAQVLLFDDKIIPYPEIAIHKEYKAEKISEVWKGKSDTSFICGHVIDDKILYPATGYLYLIWSLMAVKTSQPAYKFNVIIENVRFHRACSCGDKPVELYSVLHGDGEFEISQDNELIVTGHISGHDEEITGLIDSKVDLQNENEFVLSDKDFYRELRLRGYNYRGLFRGIQEAGPRSAKIKWDDEWITFLDNMMQFAILQADTRSLMVPVGIDRLIIYAKDFNEYITKNEDKLISVNYCEKTKSIYNQFVEMRGLTARSIPRRKERLLPVLESYEFIPNKFNTDLKTSMRINIQILLENKATKNFKIVEVLGLEQESLMSEVCGVIEDLPLVVPEIVVVTSKDNFQMENVIVQDKMTQDNLLFVCQGADARMITEAENALIEDGFLLCFNEPDFTLHDNFILLTRHNINAERTAYFFRKRRATKSKTVICELSDMETFKWVDELKNAMQTKDDVVLFSQNDYTNGILGFTNCLTKEPGLENKVRCALLQEQNNNVENLNTQLAKNMTINVYKNGEWGTYRHLPLRDLESKPTKYFYAKTVIPGDLASVNWMEQAKPLCENNSYKVEYSCLNFRDLMIASGKLSAETITNDRFLLNCMEGFEFAGYTSSGEAILGFGSSAISNIVTNVDLIIKKPEAWSMEEAATIAVVYLTVLYALQKVAKIQKGQSILIHSGTGGIGLAALNVCTYYDCDIFVTVGTQEKRDYLLANYPNIKAEKIGNSRDTSFKDMVRRETKGRGVDIVLNSLAEEKLQASVECLADHGTFLEIGKYDLEKNNNLKLDLAMRGCVHAGVMLDAMFQKNTKTDELEKMFIEGINNGCIKPLPRTMFEMDEIDKAYKYMATGKHIGKVLIKIDPTKERKVIPKFHCYPNAAYIIFGGLGGFGLELADWLILHGARNIILTSRRGISTGYQQYRIRIWKSYGVKVKIVTEDLINYNNCYDFIKRVNDDMPVDGIFNLAVVLKDSLWDNQTTESMQLSMSPKATLTQHLDKITRELTSELRYFVVFSSVSCGRGNAGQTNYGHANSVMERICELRHADCLPALAVQWGAVGDVGILEELQKENNEIAIGGTLQQKVRNCLEVFEKLMLQNKPIVSSMVVAEKFDKGISNTPIEAIFAILGIKISKEVNKQALLTDLGMDSMTAVEIKQVLQRDFDLILGTNNLKTLTLAKIEEMYADTDQLVTKDRDDNQLLFSLVMPRMKLSELTEGIIDFNFAKASHGDKYILAFPGIDGDTKNFEKMAKSSETHIKCVNYDGIAIDQSNMNTVVEFVLKKLQNDIITRKSFNIIAHSMGAISAFELVNRLENSNVFGTLILVDTSPHVIHRLYDNLQIKEEDDLECKAILQASKILIPNKDHYKLEEKIRSLNNFDERIEVITNELPNVTADMKSLVKRALLSHSSRLRCLREYKRKKINQKLKSKVILYKSINPTIDDIGDDYNLKLFCENVQRIDVFEGNHMTILQNEAMYSKIVTDFEF